MTAYAAAPKKLPHDHGTNTAEVIETINQHRSFEEVADAFALISDSTRLKIFWLLCHTEDCVINIAAAIEMSSPATSHHLKVLKTAGLIESRKDGKEVYYRMSDTDQAMQLHKSIDALLQIVCPNFLSEQRY